MNLSECMGDVIDHVTEIMASDWSISHVGVTWGMVDDAMVGDVM